MAADRPGGDRTLAALAAAARCGQKDNHNAAEKTNGYSSTHSFPQCAAKTIAGVANEGGRERLLG
jgi:hypothetical protein